MKPLPAGKNFFTAAALVVLGTFCWLLQSCHSATTPPLRVELSEKERADDFDTAWEFIGKHDGLLPSKPVDWAAAKTFYRLQAVAAKNNRQFAAVLEQLLDELHDPHAHLNMNWADSWCLPPHDIWAEWRAGSALVVEVRRDSAAARAGIKPGDEIISREGIPLRAAATDRLGRCLTKPDISAEQWALLSVLSGRHNETRHLTLRSPNGEIRECSLAPDSPPKPGAILESRRLPNGLGYIRLTTFTEAGLVGEFDAALEMMRYTSGLVLDVRDNNGGATFVGLPIAGRFIGKRTQFGWMARRDGAGLGKRWISDLPARGPWTYTKPVVVLVNHWSESMAEQFAMALDVTGRARTVGTRMAGCGAMVRELRLPHSGIPFQISERPVFQLSGTLLNDFRPDVEVALDPANASESADPILDAGIAELWRRIAQ
jgi:carboxyl-terminal processing protease